ncbi:hypothetical protein C8R43DRAFT_1127963 [Mycena crocata]|nr:hypothetical protein C8R43DRAFT_1127963 [Mycena crocata]
MSLDFSGQDPTTSVVPQNSKFPDTCLTPQNGKYVIERLSFSLRWQIFTGYHLLTKQKSSVEIYGVILHLYFGIAECIIPVGHLEEPIDLDAFAFTLAGPCDANGKKKFYVMSGYPEFSLEQTALCVSNSGFSCISEFYLNCSTETTSFLEPVQGRKEATMSKFEELGVGKRLSQTDDDADNDLWTK